MQAGHGKEEIAKHLVRDKSTIYREVKRNSGKRGYRPRQAHMKAIERREKKIHPRFSSHLWAFIEDLVRKDWSPEQISGRLKTEHGTTISHETIYQYIYEDKKTEGDLHTHLRCQKKRRKRYGSGRNRRGVIPNKTSIDERPAIVDDRGRIGDWEGDTIIGKGHQGALVSIVERASLFTVIRSVLRKTAPAVTEAMTSGLSQYADRVLSITLDNGKEFAGHEKIAEALGTDVYFAHPYASWERGTNENTNGLLRQYFSKKRKLNDEYRPGQPKNTPLFRLPDSHYEDFRNTYDECFSKRYCFWRPIIDEVVTKYKQCGDPHSELFPTLRCLDRRLVMWATRKYKRFRGHRRKAAHWLDRIARREPDMFAHWRLLHASGER